MFVTKRETPSLYSIHKELLLLGVLLEYDECITMLNASDLQMHPFCSNLSTYTSLLIVRLLNQHHLGFCARTTHVKHLFCDINMHIAFKNARCFAGYMSRFFCGILLTVCGRFMK